MLVSKMNKTSIIFRKFCNVGNDTKRICIVGAGPAGFYAAMHITKNLKNVHIDFIEKLPVPFGLIRYGVAPDHPEVKNVINQFTKVAKQVNVNFYGNISLGTDVKLSSLRKHYHAVLLTYGADKDKLLGIENENTDNIIAARRFVGWYNGMPDDNDLKVDLSGERAAVLGQGNVALDVARILLTSIDELRKTDITEHALNVLAESKIRELYLVGRRGPLQVAFTIKELREQIKMKDCITIWRKSDFVGVPEIIDKLPRPRKRLIELMLKSLNENHDTHSVSQDKKIFRPIFFRSPVKFLVDNNILKGVEFSCNKLVGEDIAEQKCISTADREILDCTLVFRSIGYKSVKVDDEINFNENNGLIVNDKGRVLDVKNDSLAKLYVAGWLGTGPVGVLLHTMGNAFQVAKAICEDLSVTGDSSVKGGFEVIKKDLLQNNIKIVDWSGWEKIDKYEVEQGKKNGKPREKVCNVEKMLEIAT